MRRHRSATAPGEHDGRRHRGRGPRGQPRILERALLQEYLLFGAARELPDAPAGVATTTRVLRGAMRTLAPLAAATRR